MNKLLITGAGGFVGKNLIKKLKQTNLKEELFYFPVYSKEFNLKHPQRTKYLIEDNKPTHVIHLASRVAGLGGHLGKHYQFLYDNLLINTNLLEECRKNNVQNMLAISSIAAFPDIQMRLDESMLNTARPHSAELGYSLSKCLLDDQIQLLRQEYNLNYSNIIPVNIYGPDDNFNPDTAHCIPSLIYKFYEAIKNNTNVEIWGNGSSQRQFIFVEDLVDILIKMLFMGKYPDRLIVAHPQIYSIKEVVNLLVKITNFKNDIIYNTNKPVGLHGRECDISKLNNLKLGPPSTNLEQGLEKTWIWYNVLHNET